MPQDLSILDEWLTEAVREAVYHPVDERIAVVGNVLKAHIEHQDHEVTKKLEVPSVEPAELSALSSAIASKINLVQQTPEPLRALAAALLGEEQPVSPVARRRASVAPTNFARRRSVMPTPAMMAAKVLSARSTS